MRSRETSPSSPRTRRSRSSTLNSNVPQGSTASPETNILLTDAPPSSAIQSPSVISQITEDGPIPVVAGPLPVLDHGAPDSVDPPPYQDDLVLEPMTAEQTTRYDRGPLPTKDLPKHLRIPMALYTLTPPPITPVPQGWIEFVHPEGQKYYYQPNRRIITDSNIKQPTVLQALVRALAKLDMRLNQQNLILPQTTEVTFEVDIDQNPPVVRYYFVDHAQKTEFWLEETSTEKLKCPPVTSYTHLKILFRQHYWTHIEFYPMHLTLSMEVEDELVAVLTHACVDYMTSSLSTVPYNQEQCDAYLRLIRNLPDSDRAEGYRNCVLARLWSEIDGNFFVNLRGEDTPRLSRIQRLLPEPTIRNTVLVNFFKNWLMLGSSELYERVLSEMWVDKISYASHWRKFMGSMVSEWKMHAVWTFVLLIVTAITFAISVTSKTIRDGWTSIFIQSIGLISIIVSLVGLGASFLLVKMHRNQTEASASEAGDYLDKYFHKQLGLQPLSIIYALPQASSVWSFTFLVVTILAFTVHLNSPVARVFVCIFTLFVVIALWFLSVCLSGKDDGTGSLLKDGIIKATHPLPEWVRGIPDRIRALLRGAPNRNTIVEEEISNGINHSTGDTNGGSGTTSDGNIGLQTVERNTVDAESNELDSRASSGSNISGRQLHAPEYLRRGDRVFGDIQRGQHISEYVHRGDSVLQIITSSANVAAAMMYNQIRSTVLRLTNRRDALHGYQRIDPTGSPLEATFRSPQASGVQSGAGGNPGRYNESHSNLVGHVSSWNDVHDLMQPPAEEMV